MYTYRERLLLIQAPILLKFVKELIVLILNHKPDHLAFMMNAILVAMILTELGVLVHTVHVQPVLLRSKE